MRIRLYTDYALRALVYLGTSGDERVTIREIATSYGISRHHLVKVCHDLQKRGYINSTRGKGGGIRLRRAATEIRLGQLFREMEQDLTFAECFGADNACLITRACRLKHVLDEALQGFLGVLDRYTLADICEQKERLQQLLTAVPPPPTPPIRPRVRSVS